MNNKKSFTLIELMIMVIIAGILATLAIPAYSNYMEDAKAKVCATNLQALQTALEIYVREQDSIPGTLSQIPQRYLNQGYAKVMENKKESWKINLAYFSLGLLDRKYALAQSLSLLDLARGNHGLLVCPADIRNTPNKISYAFNKQLQNMTRQDLFFFGGISIGEFDVGSSPIPGVLNANNIVKRHKKFNLGSVTGNYRGQYGQAVFGCGASGVKDQSTCVASCVLRQQKCEEEMAKTGTNSCSPNDDSSCDPAYRNKMVCGNLGSECSYNCGKLFPQI